MSNKAIHELRSGLKRGPVNRPLFRYLDTVGDGSGTKIFNSTAVSTVAFCAPGAGEVFRVERLLVHIADAQGAPLEYGALGTLSEGIELKVFRDGVEIVDLTAGIPIVSNSGWARVCHDVLSNDWGTPAEDISISARWTFGKAGQPLRLEGDKSDTFELHMNDDFTGLIDHTFMIQGSIE